MKQVAFDIETIPNEDLVELLPEIEPPKNYKDADKIQEYLTGKRDDQIADMALDPNWGKIVSIAMWDGEKLTVHSQKNCSEEVLILESFWDTIQHYSSYVTFNGKLFDVPYIKRRSWYCGVRPTKHIETNIYKSSYHVDVRMDLTDCDRRGHGSLGVFYKLKFGRDIEGDGGSVWGLYKQGKLDEIEAHNISDVKATWELYKSLEGYY